MTIDPALIERVYEAAALPELWPKVLQAVAQTVQAFGVCFAHRTVDSGSWTISSGMEDLVADYLSGGWLARDDRVVPVLNEQHPGFRLGSDYWSEQEQKALPLYRDFLLPRGLTADAASFVQGSRDDAMLIGVEGLPSFAAAQSAVPVLDAFRPHLARAISLTTQVQANKAANAIRALDLAGIAAAVMGGDGRLRAINDRFASRMGNGFIDRPRSVRFADRFLHAQFTAALAALYAGEASRSVAVASEEGSLPFVIHLLPLRRGARDVFGSDGVLMLLAEGANASIPNADVLRLLFDLTPAEARLTRHLLEGRSVAEAARTLRITQNTARVHLRTVFAKTGTHRQPELLRLLLGLGGPGS